MSQFTHGHDLLIGVGAALPQTRASFQAKHGDSPRFYGKSAKICVAPRPRSLLVSLSDSLFAKIQGK